MSERERLADLILHTPKLNFPAGSRAQGKTYQTALNMADHLLANGVIVTDTNVGCKWCDEYALDNLVCYIPTNDGASIDPPVRYCPFCGRRILEEATTADVAPMAEVAREIFEEIERLMLDGVIGGKYPAKVINPEKFAELKKKYMGADHDPA